MQAYSLVVTKSSRLKTAQGLLLYQWHMLGSGNVFMVRQGYIIDWLTVLICSFAEKLIKAMKGENGIVEPTFIYLPGVPGGDAIAKLTGVEYFSVPVELGVQNNSTISLSFSRAD